jgi:hypothetical protein
MRNNREISFFVPAIFPAKSFTLVLLLLIGQRALGQLSDSFSDGDFTSNPVWSGSANVFTINPSQQLQLNSLAAATSYLSTPVSLTNLDELHWQFFVKQSFAASSSNFGRVYLVSDQENLAGPLNGYFVQFGEAGTLDAVELFRQTGTTLTSICRGTSGKIANSFGIRVKVSRDNTGLWKLFVDYNGTTDFIQEASGTDATHSASSFTGVLCVYTLTNATKFFYDDFSITPSGVADTSPPNVQSVSVASGNELTIAFSESVDENTSENIINYSVLGGIGNPASATLQGDNKSVKLLFQQSFPNGVDQKIEITGVKDAAGNIMLASAKTFMYFRAVAATTNDIIINEIFADPSPSVGLPEVEFLEIYNRSANPFNLAGWKITDGSTTGILSSMILVAGDHVILAPVSTVSQFTSFGKVMGLSIFPTLNNSGDALTLMDPNGNSINSVKYSSAWYNDEDKQSGGYSLERIDPDDACGESENWAASNNVQGGSPGVRNSVFAITPDVEGPKLNTCTAIDPQTIELEFDEKLSSTLPLPSDLSISPQLSVSSISFVDASLKKLKVELAEQISATQIYQIIATNVFDCPGNVIQAEFNKVELKLDTTRPTILELKVISKNELEVTYSEAVASADVYNSENYLTLTNQSPTTITNTGGNAYRLVFETDFVNGGQNNLTIENIRDHVGNSLEPTSLQFMFFVEQPSYFKDIVINEIFADQSPSVGLPEAEFVEIYNRSDRAFDLVGWTISDDGNPTTLSSKIILPNEYLILCASNQAYKFVSLGAVLAVANFPSLNNTADSFVIRNREGVRIDSIRYDMEWYQDSEKQDGGWSLELIYPQNICAEKDNWRASEDPAGGTPGKLNSIYEEKLDLSGPRLISCVALAETLLRVTFDEKLDIVPPLVEWFSFLPQLSVQKITFSDESLTTLILALAEPMQKSVRYKMVVQRVYDCPGNTIEEHSNSFEFALAEPAEHLDIVVNEILFNPTSTGTDFIEVYNRSEKYINLRNWKLASISDGEFTNHKEISISDLLLEPHGYLVFTEDEIVLKSEYPQGQELTFRQMDIPSLADGEGSVVLSSEDGQEIDRVHYQDDYHSVFIQDDEGISLERLTFGESEDAENWKSASSAVRATPGYLNSNAISGSASGDETILIEPEVFLPVDGQPNFTTINFKFDRPGYIASVRIFDSSANMIKEIANNELLGENGFFRWDGDRDDGTKAGTGSYMVYVEVFDDQGDVKRFRKRVVVAAKF